MKKILQGREKFPASPNVEYKNIDLITELKIAFFCFNCSIVLETKDVYSKVWTFYNLTPLQKGFQKHYKAVQTWISIGISLFTLRCKDRHCKRGRDNVTFPFLLYNIANNIL